MSILDQLRNTTADHVMSDAVCGSFDDLPVAQYTRRAPKNMVRIVEGADDLKVTAPRAANVGTGRPATGQVITEDGRSDRQTALMESLIDQLKVLDVALAEKARTYTDDMTAHAAWTPGMEGNASRWIGRMIAKVRELKANPPVTVTVNNVSDRAPFLPVKTDKNGKSMPLYYAVDMDETTKFYRIKAGRKPGFYFIDVQASDDFHQIRNVATKNAIISAIVAAGAQDCMARYGQLIGECGRCHRTLTDETSRARGIGPECWGKM